LTYYLADDVVGARKKRRAAEKDAVENGDDVEFPGWETLWEEHTGVEPVVLMLIEDEDGEPVRTIEANSDAGIHRVAWDLRRESPEPVKPDKPGFKAPWESDPQGPLVQPGRFSARLVVAGSTGMRSLTDEQWFAVRPLTDVDIDTTDDLTFTTRTTELARAVAGAAAELDQARERLPLIRTTILRLGKNDGVFLDRLEAVHGELERHRRVLREDPVRSKMGDAQQPSISQMVSQIARSHWNTTQAPTRTQVDSIERAEAEFTILQAEMKQTLAELDALIADLSLAGATWTSR
jgi:hypothetical protein